MRPQPQHGQKPQHLRRATLGPKAAVQVVKQWAGKRGMRRAEGLKARVGGKLMLTAGRGEAGDRRRALGQGLGAILMMRVPLLARVAASTKAKGPRELRFAPRCSGGSGGTHVPRKRRWALGWEAPRARLMARKCRPKQAVGGPRAKRVSCATHVRSQHPSCKHWPSRGKAASSQHQ